MARATIKKQSKWKKFLKKLATRYYVSVTNERTLEEVYHAKLSAIVLFIFSVLLTILTILLFSSLILFTPLNKFLPENIDEGVKNQIKVESIEIDSLTEVVELQNQYIESLKAIMRGDVKIESKDTTASDVLQAIEPQQFMQKSEEEKEFARRYEEDEMYNLANVNATPSSINFVRPAKGVITSQFNPAKGHFGIEISALSQASVSAVHQGLVFNTGYDVNTGHYVEIIHPENYISIYKGVGEIYVRTGSFVKTGQVIGSAHKNSSGRKPVLHFELWNHNVAQNPLDYMVFE